ncbi:protein O-mannosyl-transferase 1-like protein [Dinothrombium tinctorium]|uniref:Protein O-mannosyltransferase 1 n=1 Tax=Dinothrombium tinctorium TaxID=1965070 RepID=A0A3S3PD35_9ACAR|nr:protein O-mannosyl-transferase 1-like protein [Dinothrombium tinctorium]
MKSADCDRFDHNPFVVTFKLDLIASLLFLVAIVFRVWKLDFPPSIVFDELHYGRYVSLYRNRIFYFASQPPLGIQLLSIVAYFAGYNGDNVFKNIGGEYNANFPIKSLRFIPAFCGSLMVPLVYLITIQIGLSHQTAVLAAVFVMLENSLLTQSRFILMDTILMFFVILAIYAFTKFRKQNVFDRSWFLLLLLTSTSLALALCVKYIGFVYICLVVCLTFYDFWWRLADKTVKATSLFLQSLTYFFFFVIWPLIIYVFVFYIHLKVLTNAGPHDNIMTSAFQASLEGGLASITKGQPLEIIHGSQVTLRHTHGRTCWLHSHSELYPIKYPDNRGSSHQQQVTCYSFKDVNNWWIVKKPDRNDLIATEPLERIKHGDIIQLIHGMTSRSLNSHDVAAPMSPQHQEVSCYIDYNISMPSQNLWKVLLINGEETDNYWHTIISKVRLIHVNSSQALKFSGKQLPDWGFHQHELVTDRLINQDDTVWNVEEHRYTKIADEKERELDLVRAEFVPLTPVKLTFWEKMKELQYKMLTFDQEVVKEHIYASESPIDWLFLKKGIAYWINTDDNSQVHLLGNIFLWYAATSALLVYFFLLTFYLLRRKRNFYDISADTWQTIINIGQICGLAYLFHLLPYFFTDRPLFLYHYLPAVVFKIIILAALFELAQRITGLKYTFEFLKIGFFVISFFIFFKFLPLSYGDGALSARDVNELKLKETWQFIIHKH